MENNIESTLKNMIMDDNEVHDIMDLMDNVDTPEKLEVLESILHNNDLNIVIAKKLEKINKHL